MAAEHLAVIRSEDEEGVAERVRVDERLKQQAQVVIDIADRSGVLGPHPALVTLVEVPRGAQLPVVASLPSPRFCGDGSAAESYIPAMDGCARDRSRPARRAGPERASGG